MNRTELGAALARMRGGLGGIALLSAAINILTLTGSIYLMVVYDRVLPAQSEPTLFAVFAMIGVAYVFFGAFDVLRSRMLGDVAGALDEQLIERAQAIEARIALERPDQRSNAPMRDLDQLRGFLAGPGPSAIIDLPWILFFLIVLTLMHWWFGLVTLIGALVLAGLTVIAERVNSTHVMAVGEAGAQRQMLADRQWRHAELIAALGMRERMAAGWRAVHREYLSRQSRLTDTASTLGGLSKVFRMFLQAAILTVGAILVIEGRATAGVIFASSIIAGRALAPVDQAIANWRGFVAARQSWARLNTLLAQLPEQAPERTELPPPARNLTVEGVALVPPGGQSPVVTDARFTVNAGQVLAVIGASASGKSSLMRGVVGAWRPVRGTIRLDGATIDQWDGETLGRHIGYLPQSVELFRGTVAENIARFEPDAPSDAIIAAARAAGVHDLILLLPKGYETQAGEEGNNLSAGQRQRIALARALYRQPFLLVLDEPNSNLDPDGEAALASAIDRVRGRGGIVLVVTHRRALVGTADLLLVMRGGTPQAFGPRDEVLARMQQPPPPGGGEPGLTVVGRR